jgi:hypothetical protein
VVNVNSFPQRATALEYDSEALQSEDRIGGRNIVRHSRL